MSSSYPEYIIAFTKDVYIMDDTDNKIGLDKGNFEWDLYNYLNINSNDKTNVGWATEIFNNWKIEFDNVQYTFINYSENIWSDPNIMYVSTTPEYSPGENNLGSDSLGTKSIKFLHKISNSEPEPEPEPEPYAQGDMNKDHSIDNQDLLKVKNNWGKLNHGVHELNSIIENQL